jgi:superfamily II DNA or RNA helicase
MPERATAARILGSCRHWPDLRRRLAQLDTRAKGDFFEAIVEAYLRFDPKYRTLFRAVWNVPRGQVPRDVAARLRLPGTDEGIDLVAETVDGGYWAIQCKYREDEEHSTTLRELSTFTTTAFVNCKGFEQGLVCTTADRSSHRLKKYGDRLQFQAGDVWRGLGPEFFAYLRKGITARPPVPKPHEPRLHQRVAVGAANRHFVAEESARGKLIMPCGTGKSLTAFWIADRLQARKILVAVPSLALVRQTLDVWSREFLAHGKRPRWIAVCSDEAVGNAARDDAAVLVQDLGVRVHTDPREIAVWMRQCGKGDLTVVFTTYQSGKATAAAARKAGFVFDLAIMDEAHKTVGHHGSAWAHLLHDENVRVKQRVFMTATERYFKGAATRDDIASMDDAELYGDTFHQLSFKEAIEESRPPILADYTVLTIVVGRGEVRKLIEERRFVRPKGEAWDVETEARTFAAAVALRRAMAEHPIHHAVSFHSSVKRARDFAELLAQLTKGLGKTRSISTFHVSGAMPTPKRERELTDFVAAESALVTNARCLTEGVDVPMIDGVLFADPRQSRIDIVQAVGRALRPAEGKKRGYVIVPVLLNEDAKGEEAAEGAFRQVLDVLASLAANDERIVEYLRALSQGRKWQGSPIIEVELPDGFEIDPAEFAAAVELRAWKRLARLSWRPFEEARSWAHQLGLRSFTGWREFLRGEHPDLPKRPVDVPGNPARAYSGTGWAGWGDWLGTGAVASRWHEYRPFKEARAFVHSLRLTSRDEWRTYCLSGQRPDDIPADPSRTYRNSGWTSMGDWLGTGTVSTRVRTYRPFDAAREHVRSLKLRGESDWRAYCKSGKKPDDIPQDAARIYRTDGWRGMGDWLGTGTVSVALREFRSFEDARHLARSLGLKSASEWREYSRSGQRPADIPSSPQVAYRDVGWAGFGDWLGTSRVSTNRRHFRPFEDARTFARSLGLDGEAAWIEFARTSRKPADIPSDPRQTYKGRGWKGIGDWLGTGAVANAEREYRPFLAAREYVRSLGLRSEAEWFAFAKSGEKPDDIPTGPRRAYKGKGWISMGDWLGTGRVADRLKQYRPFDEARSFVRTLRLRSQREWFAFAKSNRKPADIPANPANTYEGKGWVGIGDWLGTAKRRDVIARRDADGRIVEARPNAKVGRRRHLRHDCSGVRGAGAECSGVAPRRVPVTS